MKNKNTIKNFKNLLFINNETFLFRSKIKKTAIDKKTYLI